MSGEGSRGAESPVAHTADSGEATLVCGGADHDAACRHLARPESDGATRIRVTTGEGATEPSSDAEESYETGVYDGLGLAEAGVVVSDSIENLRNDGGTAGTDPFVVCIDGVPHPDETDERERLFRFLHALTSRVGDVSGDCHVHLSVPRNAPLTAVLEPLFDDVVTADEPNPAGRRR